MNRVRNTAQSERKLATDFSGCHPAHSELLEASLWGMRQGGWTVWSIMDLIMVPMMANGGQSLCIWSDSLCCLSECQWCVYMETQGLHQTSHVLRRNKSAHHSPSTLSPLQPGCTFLRRPRITPNLYSGELCSLRNIHHVCFPLTQFKERLGERVIPQVEDKKMWLPFSNCI